MEKIRKEKLIEDTDPFEFEAKCNQFNKTHNVYATLFQVVNTEAGVKYIALKFYEEGTYIEEKQKASKIKSNFKY